MLRPLTLALVTAAWATTAAAAPTNVILFIADGMGAEAIDAGRYLLNGDAAPLFFETFPHAGWMTHHASGGVLTDSAAAATAMATAQKVDNGVISVQLPGNGSALPTVLESQKALGKRTGLVTLGTPITDATPAAFGAHTNSRSNSADIADDYLTDSRPNVLFGRSQSNLLADAPGAGYTVATTVAGFNALNPTSSTHYAGLFSSGQEPTLAAMTTKALDILSHNSPNGFFAVIENENTDSGGHANNISQVANGVIQFDDAVEAAYNWAAAEGKLADTLFIVTADHETGGLNATNNGAGVVPSATWTTGGHTQNPVRIFARGPNAGHVAGYLDNTVLPTIIGTSLAPPPTTTRTFRQGVAGYVGAVDTHVRADDANLAFAGATVLVSDLDDDSAAGNQASQALIKFNDLFGPNADQIPSGAAIVSASLVIRTGSAANDQSPDLTRVVRMLAPWDANSTWNSLAGGVAANGVEASSTDESRLQPSTLQSQLAFDVTAAVQAWANGQDNHGLALLPLGTNGWRFRSSEAAAELRPMLSVTFVDATAGSGDFDVDGDVDGADFLTWQRGAGTTYNAVHLDAWKNTFGTGDNASPVPEPPALALMLIAVGLAASRRSRPTHR